MTDHLRPGDAVVVVLLDRPGRPPADPARLDAGLRLVASGLG